MYCATTCSESGRSSCSGFEKRNITYTKPTERLPSSRVMSRVRDDGKEYITTMLNSMPKAPASIMNGTVRKAYER